MDSRLRRIQNSPPLVRVSPSSLLDRLKLQPQSRYNSLFQTRTRFLLRVQPASFLPSQTISPPPRAPLSNARPACSSNGTLPGPFRRVGPTRPCALRARSDSQWPPVPGRNLAAKAICCCATECSDSETHTWIGSPMHRSSSCETPTPLPSRRSSLRSTLQSHQPDGNRPT